MENKMFCYQCQETAGCKGCTIVGVCGKKPEVAAMQDLLIYVTKGLSAVTTALRAAGKNVDRNVNHLVTVNLFTTITNANFDREAIIDRIKDTLKVKADLLAPSRHRENLPEAALYNDGRDRIDEKAKKVGVLATENEDIRPARAHYVRPQRPRCLRQACQRSEPGK
jgi:hydroxylamine reductase